MNILVISAHPDDEILGCGGTIAKYTANHDSVFVLSLCEHVSARKLKPQHQKFLKQIKEASKILGIKKTLFFDFPNLEMNTVPILGIVQSIEKAIIKFKPEIIYTHHHGDVNEDHQIVFRATMAAVRLPQRQTSKLTPDLIKKIYTYEVPSSTDWIPSLPHLNFTPNVFVNIEEFYNKKIRSLLCYKNIICSPPHPRSLETLKALAVIRGSQAGYKLAEGFYLIKELL